MPRLRQKTPKYRKHRASGQALVELNGGRYYLGPHGRYGKNKNALAPTIPLEVRAKTR